MADNHFDLVIVWDNLGGAVRVNAGGKATVTDPATGDLVTVVQDGQSVSTVTADVNGRVSFVAQQGTVKLTAGGLAMIAVSAEQATAGAVNAAAAQSAQLAAENARDAAIAARDDTVTGLAAKQERFQVDVSTYVGTGSTDETAAIAAALADVAAGGTLFFPRLTFGQSYRTTAPIVISKSNIRMLGGGRDAYAVNIQGMTPGMDVVQVKAPGFVLDGLGLIGSDGQTTNGAGATITGLHLFGDTDGNIDARVSGATFQYLAVGVRTRGRNATITGETIFSNSLKGVVIDGPDATYHTGPNADQNRGNTITGCRFHNMGAASTDAAVEITNTAKVLHALISGNYFDSNGLGAHVRATGTSTNPHKQLTLVGNKHAETQADVYALTWCNFATIADIMIQGYTGGAFGNGFTLTNCDTVQISNVVGVQIGRSGLVARSCGRIFVRDVTFMTGGIDPASTGHGFDVDSTNSGCSFDQCKVIAFDGWGFIGDPANTSMTDCDFVTDTLGRISSATVTNRAVAGLNEFIEGQFGRYEDNARKPRDLAAGAPTDVATIAGGGNFSSFMVEVSFTARDGGGDCYILARRSVRTENGAPVVTTVGVDSLARVGVTFAASGTSGVKVTLTSTAAASGVVNVRAWAGGAANAVNGRGVTVTML